MPSTTTFLQLVNRILEQTGQRLITTVANAETPAAQVKTLINQVLLDVMTQTQSARLVQSATAAITADTATVTLAADCPPDNLLPDSLVLASSKTILMELDATHPRIAQMQLDDLSGTPCWFIRQSNNQSHTITLLPSPDNNDTLHYQYRQQPSPLTNDSDTLPIPEEWIPIVAMGTQALLEKFLGEDGYPVTYQLYRDQLTRLKASLPIRKHPRMQGPYKGYQR